ncbi:MAG: DMT family transporter [Ruminococcaceae bacterium]|nr:DMT family transporter [Oscillospiraceae bacterium]
MNITKQKITGHIFAFIVVSIWSITYVATDMLLANGITALQILVLRFFLALGVLYILKPKLYLPKSFKEELGFVFIAMFGMFFYYVLENFAIGKTDGTNVSIIISFVPILTTLASAFFTKKTGITSLTILGFAIAISGVVMVVFNGTVTLDFDFLGYILAFGAALCWTVYSVLLEKYLERFDSIIITRRMLIYTLIPLTPMTFIIDGIPNMKTFVETPVLIACISLLGIFGGSLCYHWWNKATRNLGVVITTNYLYMSPFITMVFAFFATKTPITAMGICGAILILFGVILSDLRK